MPKSSQRRKRATPATPPAVPDRRAVLRRAAVILGAALALGAGGVFSVNAVQATLAEHDLARIGTGQPTIVQIHDPTCALCTELQRETRKALRHFPEGALTYLVANIQTDEGAGFALRHRQPHVTLVLMDGAGRVQQVINGVTPAKQLRTAFAAHLARNGAP